MMNIKRVLIAFVAIVGIAGTSYGWIHADRTNHHLRTQLESGQHTIDQKNQAVSKQSEQVQTQFQNNAINNTDPKISSVAIQNARVEQASQASKKFFNTYYSFGDSDDYNSRGSDLLKQGLITRSVAQDSQLFGSDKIVSGLNYVDTVGLNANFHSAYTFLPMIDRSSDTVDLLTQVEYDSGYNNQRPATTDVVYRVSYDLASHKITQVQEESSLFKNTDALNRLNTNGYLSNP